uniref:Uncharacterized protein n=1 Tax=Coccidioides posadasii RMSCC 3488 TaxID=454284 RepID=A0A0J6FEE3_COCPO|nr:hypothetical protein CPAG_05012 [Coccidioides posadasii RMSCC 3488]
MEHYSSLGDGNADLALAVIGLAPAAEPRVTQRFIHVTDGWALALRWVALAPLPSLLSLAATWTTTHRNPKVSVQPVLSPFHHPPSILVPASPASTLDLNSSPIAHIPLSRINHPPPKLDLPFPTVVASSLPEHCLYFGTTLSLFLSSHNRIVALPRLSHSRILCAFGGTFTHQSDSLIWIPHVSSVIMTDQPLLKKACLEPAAEIAVPSSPIPARSSLSASPDDLPLSINPSERTKFASPQPPASSSEMTPPPSRNAPHESTPVRAFSEHNPFLVSPPATVNQTLCVAYGASKSLPTSTDIEDADTESLRKMAKGLLAVAQESRMSAAHFKLQHSLLSLTSSEAIKRAEVEQQLAKREIEILQSADYRSRQNLMRQTSPHPQLNADLEAAVHRIKELEHANMTLDRRLRRAKKLIEEHAGKYGLLEEENGLLKQRIRENRVHFTQLMDQGSISSSPRTEFNTPHRKPIPDGARSHISRVGSHHPFAALLAADQVLNGESASIKSPVSKKNSQKNHGHARGTHSLSSLPTTPQRNSVGNDRIHFFTPIINGSTAPL